MSIELTGGKLTLSPHGVALLTRARGVRVTAQRGTAWLTIDGVREDIVLDAGAAYRIDNDRDVVISAIAGPVAVALHAPAPAAEPTLMNRLRERLAGLFTARRALGA